MQNEGSQMPQQGNTAAKPKTDTLTEYLLDPVQGIRVLPEGPYYQLDDFMDGGELVGRISVGRESFCQIRLDDSSVSAMHCFLYRRHDQRLFVDEWENKNPVQVNGVPLRRGSVEVFSGFLILVGRVYLLACGKAGIGQKAQITSSGLDGLMFQAVELYGSERKAAEALGLPQSTLNRWHSSGGRFELRTNASKDANATRRKA